MKKILLLISALLLTTQTMGVFANWDNWDNVKLYIPEGTKIEHHIYYHNNLIRDIQVPKISGLVKSVLESSKGKELLENNDLRIIGSPYKKALFEVDTETKNLDYPLWYYEQNSDYVTIPSNKVVTFNHSIKLDFSHTEIKPNSNTLKWYPRLKGFGAPFAQNNTKIYIFDDVFLPQNFEVWLEYLSPKGLESVKLEITKNYEVRKLAWTTDGIWTDDINQTKFMVFIPYYEIKIPEGIVYAENPTLHINYDLIDELLYEEDVKVYLNGGYIPVVEYVKY